jgi:hypothetical protein
MSERTRTIWEGRCPTCGENGFAPETTQGKTLSASRWCEKCQTIVDCKKTSYTGPELEPMVPDIHHIWCNGQKGPVKGCLWCCRQNKETGLWEGLWLSYPYDPAYGPPEDFAEKHFPGVIRRT